MYALLLLAALASSAPQLNLSKICAASADAALPADKKGSYDACIREETAARDKLQQTWSQFPAKARTDCIIPSGVSESYVELLTCLQMESGKDFGPVSPPPEKVHKP